MNEIKWAEFFSMLDDITNAEGAWIDKKQRIIDEAKKAGSDTTLEEFLDWFGGGLPTGRDGK